MKFKQFIAVLLISAATFAGSGWIYGKYNHHDLLASNIPVSSSVFKTTKYTDDASSVPMTDFESAAAKATPAVVHIKVLNPTWKSSIQKLA